MNAPLATGSTPDRIDPDHYLDLSGAVAVSRDDVREAWERAYADVAQRLSASGPSASLVVVFGLQGAGKTTWVAENAVQTSSPTVYLSGPLPSRRHRARAIGLARIREEAMRHVEGALEPPSLDEGFDEVLIVRSPAAEASSIGQ